MLPEQKLCPRCGEIKLREDYYYALLPKREYISSYCKSCNYQRSRNWIKDNPDKNRKYQRESKMRMRLNPEKRNREKNNRKKYYANLSGEKKKKISEYKKLYYQERYYSDADYRANMLLNNKIWINKNRERYNELQRQNLSKRRAILNKSPLGEKVSVYIIRDKMLHQNGLCFYCNINILSFYHIDHFIPISKGGAHSEENIVLACPKCNHMKSAKMPGEFCIMLKNWR